MFAPTDKKLQDIIEEVSDDLISMVEMELDEGSWVSKFYRRCQDLGLETNDALKMRQVADEILSLRLAQNMLTRLVVEEA